MNGEIAGRSKGPRRLANVIALAAALGGLSACRTENFYEPDHTPPSVPVGVVSVTGDEEVSLYWYDVPDRDLAGYRIYWSDAPEGPYELLAETSQDWYRDRGLANGHTYFYGVTSFDRSGNESAMSEDVVYDTPRPEGYDLVLRDASGSRPEWSGYDFSAYQVIPWDAQRTDVFFAFESNTPRMIAANAETDIQDAGYVALVDVDWAPERGWSPTGRADLVVGHSYVVWTSDDHYAKFEVRSIQSDRVVLDWAYQVDRGNPELSPRSGPRAGGREAP